MFYSAVKYVWNILSTVQIKRWRGLWAEGTSCFSTGGPDASHHAAGQGNSSQLNITTSDRDTCPFVFMTHCMHLLYKWVRTCMYIHVYIQSNVPPKANTLMLICFVLFSVFVQLAMRGPTGPMGLTGRPGPLVCTLHPPIRKHQDNLLNCCLCLLIDQSWLRLYKISDVFPLFFNPFLGSTRCTRTEGRVWRGGTSGTKCRTFLSIIHWECNHQITLPSFCKEKKTRRKTNQYLWLTNVLFQGPRGPLGSAGPTGKPGRRVHVWVNFPQTPTSSFICLRSHLWTKSSSYSTLQLFNGPLLHCQRS